MAGSGESSIHAVGMDGRIVFFFLSFSPQAEPEKIELCMASLRFSV